MNFSDNLNYMILYFQSKNKVSLRNLSMVLRQLNVSAEQRAKNIEESVEKAKEAVQLDIKDGISWCKIDGGVLGGWGGLRKIHLSYEYAVIYALQCLNIP